MNRLLLVASALACLSTKAFTQSPAEPIGSDVQSWLAAHPWNPKDGVLLMAQTRTPLDQAANDNIGWQEIRCGQATAIAPQTMVVIDANLQDPPNLYDGLTRKDKILYLASTLSQDQWRVAGAGGIGINDLRDDQRGVFRSIVPSEMNVNQLTDNVVTASNHLARNDLAGTRLHFFRELNGLGFHMPGGYAMTSGQFGRTLGQVARDASQDDVHTAVYGVTVRKVLPNELKPSNLDYASHRLDPVVPVSPHYTIRDLLAAVSVATGLNLKADVRIADESLSLYGTAARSGDILKALALAVTGAFRQVGNLYLLTSDVEGLGTRQERIAVFKCTLDAIVRKREAEWYRRIGESAPLGQLTYDPADSLAPQGAMKHWMDTHLSPDEDYWMPSADLPSTWRIVLEQMSTRLPSVGTDQIEPLEQILCSFVLPNGAKVQPEDGIGMHDVRQAFQTFYPPRPPVPPAAIADPSAAALAFEVSGDTDAQTAVALAKRYGFGQVWIGSLSKPSIQSAASSAANAGIKAQLLVLPWKMPDAPTTSLDRTVLGQTAKDSSADLQTNEAVLEQMDKWGSPSVAREPEIEPLAPEAASQWSRIVDAAQTPGLTGVVLTDTEPSGYEPTRPKGMTGPDGNAFAEAGALGYSLPERVQFVNRYGVDPIDILVQTGQLTVDFSLPQLPNRSLGEGDDAFSPTGAAALLSKMLASDNRDQITRLAEAIPAPLLIEQRMPGKDSRILPEGVVEPWEKGQDLPAFHEAPFPQVPKPVTLPDQGFFIVRVAPEMRPEVENSLGALITAHATRGVRFCIDLVGVPPSKWDAILHSFLKPARS